MNAFAMLYPGQGSQFTGMLLELAQIEKSIIDTFQAASLVLGCDLWEIAQKNPEDLLNQTAYTQPILLAASVALWRIFIEKKTARPRFMAGHSLGEYSALVCSGAIQFDDGLKIVHERGRLMQEAVPAGEGAMAAIIGLSNEAVLDACDQASEAGVVAPANFNAHGQVVIAGTSAAVNLAMKAAKALGAKLVKALSVSVPSHSLLMKPAAEQLKKYLDNISIEMPSIPVIHNVDASISTSPERIREKLIEQLYCPVQWVKTIELLQANHVLTAYECGSGKVLAGLNKRIVNDFITYPMDTPETFSEALGLLS
jgi:[acyl-carrier-protein] S-malonyltransferase